MLRSAAVAGVLVLAGLVPAGSHSAPPPLRVTSPTVEATGPNGADATYEVKAFDPTSGNPLAATCDIPAGTTGSGDFTVTGHFPLGQTTVTCNTTTEDSTPVHQTGTVTVQDTTPPPVTAPANVSTSTNDPSGTTVTYGDATANDIVDGSITPTCSPASGSKFPVGTTTVTCNATDSHGNTGSASFTVTVNLVSAVTFRSASATRAARGVVVRWRTGTEAGLLGFQVDRSHGHSWRRITHSLIATKESVSEASYRFLDKTATRGVSYRYRIKAVNRDGTASWFGPVRVT
jgi:hypothetical protein